MGRIANYINRSAAVGGLSSQAENVSVNISLKVSKSAKGPSLLFQYLNFKEFTNVRKLSCFSARSVGFFESLAITVRTDNWKNGCKDFFLPTMFNYALKVNHVALKCFLCVVLVIVDLCTMPLRVITFYSRYHYNLEHAKESRVFYKYLVRNKISPSDLAQGYVHLNFEIIEVTKQPKRKTEKFNIHTGQIKGAYRFMELPEWEGSEKDSQLRDLSLGEGSARDLTADELKIVKKHFLSGAPEVD